MVQLCAHAVVPRRYFDSMTYVPSKCTGDPFDDAVAGCDAPGNYFAVLLDNHFYWQDTWAEEGGCRVDNLALRWLLWLSLSAPL